MAKTTTRQFIRDINNFRNKVLVKNEPLLIAVLDANAKMVERIFVRGKNAAGTAIGSYDRTTPLYVNPKTQSPKSFPPKGKNGKTKFKNGKQHQTGYFESYSAFRAKIGRTSSKVNLNLSGDLAADLANTKMKIGSNEFPKHNPQKVNQHQYLVTISRRKNLDKMDGAESHFSTTIFKHTKQEEKEFIQVLTKELIARI